MRSSTIQCGRTRTCHTTPLQAQAGDPRGTGTQATREDALLAGPLEGDDWLQKTTRRPKTEDQKTIPLKTRRQPLNSPSRLAHTLLLSHAHTLIGKRGNALYPYFEPSQNEMLVPIFGAKPERNTCAHIWGEVRAQRLCPYLGRSQSATLVPIFGAKPEHNTCAHIWGEVQQV